MTDRELMQQVLEALERYQVKRQDFDRFANEVTALRERLAQPEQEPVAWMNPSWIDPDTRGWASDSFESIPIEGWVPLYTAPRQWRGLTGAEIDEITDQQFGNGKDTPLYAAHRSYALDIEHKLRLKNS